MNVRILMWIVTGIVLALLQPTLFHATHAPLAWLFVSSTTISWLTPRSLLVILGLASIGELLATSTPGFIFAAISAPYAIHKLFPVKPDISFSFLSALVLIHFTQLVSSSFASTSTWLALPINLIVINTVMLTAISLLLITSFLEIAPIEQKSIISLEGHRLRDDSN